MFLINIVLGKEWIAKLRIHVNGRFRPLLYLYRCSEDRISCKRATWTRYNCFIISCSVGGRVTACCILFEIIMFFFLSQHPLWDFGFYVRGATTRSSSCTFTSSCNSQVTPRCLAHQHGPSQDAAPPPVTLPARAWTATTRMFPEVASHVRSPSQEVAPPPIAFHARPWAAASRMSCRWLLCPHVQSQELAPTIALHANA